MLPGGLRWRRSGRMDLRNHRKIAVIDNEVAYVGSQNLAGRSSCPATRTASWWRACVARQWRTWKRCSPATGTWKPASAWT